MKTIWIEVTETANYSGHVDVPDEFDKTDENVLTTFWVGLTPIQREAMFDEVTDREVSTR